jgi:hypothetical protein
MLCDALCAAASLILPSLALQLAFFGSGLPDAGRYLAMTLGLLCIPFSVQYLMMLRKRQRLPPGPMPWPFFGIFK